LTVIYLTMQNFIQELVQELATPSDAANAFLASVPNGILDKARSLDVSIIGGKV